MYCKVACLLQNLTGKRLNSDTGRLNIITKRMKSTKNVLNSLTEKVANENFNTKTAPFQEISSVDILDFPEMTL